MVTLVSCSEDNPIDVPQPEPVVTNGSGLLFATTERPHATRTALDPIMDGTTLTGYDVVWSEGDEIELIVGEGRGRRQFIYELVDGEGESSGHFRYKWYEEEGDPLADFVGQPYVPITMAMTDPTSGLCRTPDVTTAPCWLGVW